MGQSGRRPMVLCSADDARPLGANEAALELLGCSLDDLLAQPGEELAGVLEPLSLSVEPWHGQPAGHLVFLRPDLDSTLDLTDASVEAGTAGMPGRAALWGHLASALARTDVVGGTVGLLFVDIDADHDWARHLVPAVAERLLAAVRPSDLVARVGPYEFAVVCESVDGEIGAAGLAAGILDDLTEPAWVGERAIVPQVVLGIALGGDPGMTHAELASDPESATAAAKSHGRARHAAFSAAARRRSTRHELLAGALGAALEADELDVHFQPIVSLEDGRVVGIEALSRWVPPGRGAIPPDRFVPIAERSGLIHPLGRKVLRRACRFASSLPDISVAVNVSPRQVRGDLVRRVIETLEDTGLPAGRLRLELTESAFIDDPDRARDVLRRLTTLGVRLSLDDFGTGYSSLLVLRNLPFDQLKIDRSFVRSVAVEQEGRDVVAAVLGLARAVGVRTVAEGVEEAAQVRVLADLGCDEAQGFLFGSPMGAEDCERFLAAGGIRARAR